MKPRIVLISSFYFLWLVTTAFPGEPQKLEWKGKMTKEDGVVIIKNPKEPLYKNAAFTIVQDLKIGGQEGKPEYIFSGLRDIAVDSDGNIYAVEFKEKHIRVFDKNGGYIRTIGRAGQGPGEFNTPGNVHINPAGEIMATDGGKQSLMYFAPDGKYLRQYLFKTFYPAKVEYGSRDVFYVMHPSMEPPDQGFKLFRLDGRTEKSSFLAMWPMPQDKPMVVFDFSMTFVVMPDDRLLFGYPTEGYEIRIFSPEGRLERKILKDPDPRPVTAKEKEIVLDLMKKRPIPGQRKIEVAKFHPPYRAVSADDQKRIIIHVSSGISKDQSDKTEALFDIFDAEGRYLAQIGFPYKSAMDSPLWKAGKLYTIEQDQDGYPYIARYSVEFKFY
jgi:hypothetical protein